MSKDKLSCCEKFCTLMWKNLKMQTGNWVEFLFLILTCAVFPSVLLLFRLLYREFIVVPTKLPSPINLTDIPEEISFFYSPSNSLLNSFLEEVGGILNVTEIKNFTNGKDLVSALLKNKTSMGIEFPDDWSNIKELPNNFQFSLHKMHDFYNSYGYIDSVYSDESDLWQIYLKNSFLTVQQQLSIGFLRRKNSTAMALLPQVVLIPFPYPSHMTDDIEWLLGLLPLVILISFMYPCMTITKYIVSEKELQLKELMSIMGISNWMHWLAWYVKSIILLLIFSLIIALSWSYIKLPNTDGAMLPYSCTFAILLFFIVYSHSCIAFCFLVSAICSKSTWAGLTTCLLYFATYMPLMLVPSNPGLFSSIFGSIFFNSAMTMILQRIALREQQNWGLCFNNMFKTCRNGDNISIGVIMLIMLLVAIISVIICLYVEQVHPGEYGVAKPWYFLCHRSYWNHHRMPFLSRIFSLSNSISFSISGMGNRNIETPTKGRKAGVEIKGLCKTFGTKEAVKGVTFNMLEDEITVLLGHNGAGKTTTILMLAGFIPPTSGTAFINGYDISKERLKARFSLGICPQHNVLFHGLSVANHIRLFCRLRCLKKNDLNDEIQKYLEKLNLKNKASAKATSLSGGTQRRLSLACAMCGNVKVVFCDEPSSGLDPASRHSLWKFLQEEKQDRTILLTTHYMDEGEVLGDRIAIMSDGQLRCYGTLGFLKKSHDTGYILCCEIGPDCKVLQLTALIGKYIPNAYPTYMGTDVNYRLPQRFSGSFGSLFTELESSQKYLDVLGFGLSATSLADIFMSVGAEDSKQPTRNPGGTNANYQSESRNRSSNCCQQCLGQWEALFLKKIFHTYHNKFMFLIILFIPILLWILSALQKSTQISSQHGTLDISLATYEGINITILMDIQTGGSNVFEQISNTFEKIAKSQSHIKRIDKYVSEYILVMTVNNPEQRAIYDNTFLAGISMYDKPFILAWFNTKTFPHAPPLIMNLVYNTLAQVALNGYQNISIEVTNKPFYNDNDVKGVNSFVNVILIVLYLSIGLTIFVLAIVQERTLQLKMQQQSAGVNMLNYWLTHYLWDLLIYMCFALALLLPFNGEAPFGYLVLILSLIGLCGISFTYVMGQVFQGSVTAFSVIIVINLVMGVIIFSILSFVYPILKNAMENVNYLEYIMIALYFYPIFVGAFALGRCFSYNPYCMNQEDILENDDNNCDVGYSIYNPTCACQNIWTWIEVRYLFFAALLWFLVLLILEYQRLPCYAIKFICCRPGKKEIEHDNDVGRERDMIMDMKKDDRKKHALVVDRTSKNYCCLKAVNEVSLVLKTGICFGLLGANGAGKTSLFKMIAGDHAITSGEIYVKGINLKTHPYKALKHIGYCPQFDTLFTFLTGRQMLKIFLLLRGLPRKQIKEASENLASDFGFLNHLDKKTKDYSGGTKRKLNAALAANGESLILLDEPSAGVDPASRRHVWKMLQRMRENGKTILISSHSMEEVEAVCTRIAIMSRGNIHSLGSPQRIKNKFSKSFVLKLKIDSKSNGIDKILSNIENQMAKDFPSAKLEEKYEFSGQLTFHIPSENLKWSKMFYYVEYYYNSWRLSDYSITQKDLENIFLDIVKEDEEKKRQER